MLHRVKWYIYVELDFAELLVELCKIEVEIYNNDNGTTPGFFWWYNSYNNSGSFTLQDPGSYELIITVDGVEVVSTIEVALKAPTTISTQVYNSNLGIFEKASKATVFAGAPLYFMEEINEYRS